MSIQYVQIAAFPKEFNVSPLLVHFAEHNVNYKIEEHDGSQVLYVADTDAQRVAKFVQQLHGGQQPNESLKTAKESALHILRVWPATIGIIVLGIVGYLLARFDHSIALLHWFTYVNYEFVGAAQVLSPMSFDESVILSGQWWRLITPAFIHFGFLHILLNALGVWELGRRLEIYLGEITYLFMFFAIVQISNYAEYYLSGPVLFGGLSGALFGYVGLIAVLYYRTKSPILRLPKGLYVMVLAWAFIGLTGMVNKLFGVQMANGAHFGGLISGAVLGLLIPVKKRKRV